MESSRVGTLRECLAANVRALRATRGWTQEETAARCHLKIAMVRRVEAAASNTSLTTLEALAAGFGVAAATLLAPAPPPPRRAKGRPAILPKR